MAIVQFPNDNYYKVAFAGACFWETLAFLNNLYYYINATVLNDKQ